MHRRRKRTRCFWQLVYYPTTVDKKWFSQATTSIKTRPVGFSVKISLMDKENIVFANAKSTDSYGKQKFHKIYNND